MPLDDEERGHLDAAFTPINTAIAQLGKIAGAPHADADDATAPYSSPGS